AADRGPGIQPLRDAGDAGEPLRAPRPRGARANGSRRMKLAADIVIAIVALLHVWFLVLEMFLWTTPYGRKTFAMSAEQAAATRTLAMNQGLYNGFLAAGLFWGLLVGGGAGYAIKLFFLSCVFVAGVFGALTASRKILFVQALPALVALALL